MSDSEIEEDEQRNSGDSDRQGGSEYSEGKYHIEISEENIRDIIDQGNRISVVSHPTLEQACGIIGDDEQIPRVIGANHGSDVQKRVIECIEDTLTVMDKHTQDGFDRAENKIDSSVSEVKDSIRQLHEAIQRSNIRPGPARNTTDASTQTELASLLSDGDTGDNSPPHSSMLKRNSTHEFILNPDALITTDSSDVDKLDVNIDTLETNDEHEQGLYNQITPTLVDDDSDIVDDEYKENFEGSLVSSWKIEPVVWRQCIERQNENMANNLLKQRKLPDQDSLDMASAHFGRSSTIVSTICSSICSYLREKSEYIFDVWPAYEYSKMSCNGDKTRVTFVVIKENERGVDVGGIYKTYVRTALKFDLESSEVNRLEHNTDMPFGEDMENLRECVNQNSESLMVAHSNLTMVSGSLLSSKGYNTTQRTVKTKPCVVLYVHIKGLVPLNEEPFPEHIKHFPVDVREAVFAPLVGGRPNEYHEHLRMGCAIRNSNIDYQGNCSAGTLGGFLIHPEYGLCCITCAHVLCEDINSFIRYQNGVRFWTEADTNIKVFQPCSIGAHPFGNVACAVYNPGGGGRAGVDAALVKITSRSPIDGFFPDTQTFDESGFTISRPMVYSRGNICTCEKLNRGSVVIKYGCCTEVTRGIFRLQCGAIRNSNTVGQHGNFRFLLHNQIEILSTGEVDFAKEGDSGAFVFVEENDELTVIGLLEGSMGDGRYLVTPIEDILRAFGLPIEGTLTTFPILNISASLSSDNLQQSHVTFRTSTPLPLSRSACTSRSDSAVSMSMSFSEETSSLLSLVEEKFKAVEDKVRATDEDITQEVAKHALEIKEELSCSIDTKLGAIKEELKQEIQQSQHLIERQMHEQNKRLQDLLTHLIGITSQSTPPDSHVSPCDSVTA